VAFLLGLIQGPKMGVMGTLGLHPFLGKLAAAAKRIDFQRTAQQCELSQAGRAFEKLVHFGYLDVIYPSASDAQDVMMRLHVAVIAREVVQESYLARLSHLAKLLKNPMDCSQRYVRMGGTHRRAYLVGARMVLRSEQGLYDREPLGRDGNPPLAAPRDELVESLNRVPLTPPSIHQPEFSHKRPWGRLSTMYATNQRPGVKDADD
jgi:hypothetical protein